MLSNNALLSAILDTPSDTKPAELPAVATDSWGYEDHRSFMKRVYAGGVTVAEVQQAFAALLASKARVVAELAATHTVAQLEKLVRPFHKLTKPQLVEYAFNQAATDFAWLSAGDAEVLSLKHVMRGGLVAEREAVMSLTQEVMDAYVAARAARWQALRAKIAAQAEAVRDPQTLDDFRLFIKQRGSEQLTAEQLERYDALVTAHSRPAPETKSNSDQATSEAAPPALEVVESIHTKKRTPLFVVKLGERVSRAEFDRICSAAKELGGYYSSYARDGAIPGFTFGDRKSADGLKAHLEAQGSVDREPRTGEVGADEETQPGGRKAGSKLRSAAQSLLEGANEKLNADRLVNTPRRAQHANHAEATARRSISLAETILNLAQALDEGRLTVLADLREKVQVEFLDMTYRVAVLTYQRDHDEVSDPRDPAPIAKSTWPELRLYAHQANSIEIALKAKRGTKRLLDAIGAAYKASSDPGVATLDFELVQSLVEHFGSEATKVMPEYLMCRFADLKRLQRLGITRVEHLRCALREFVQYRSAPRSADAVVQAERSLVGSKVGIEFFPTPSSLADRMCEMANLRPGVRTLEPSAGNGQIADAMRRAGVEPDVIEISHELSRVLLAKGYNLVGRDFLSYMPEIPPDCICMNPPFSDDIAHIQHAHSMLAPGGNLVSVVGAGSMQNTGSVEVAFRAWLEEHGAHIEKLPDGTFTDRTLLATTGASAYLVALTN